MCLVGRSIAKWNVACAVLGVVDQWAQLFRDNMEIRRAQMRDNGAEVGGS